MSRNTHPAKRCKSRHNDKFCIDVNVHDRHILLIYEKFHFQELLPFVRVGQYCCLDLLQALSKLLRFTPSFMSKGWHSTNVNLFEMYETWKTFFDSFSCLYKLCRSSMGNTILHAEICLKCHVTVTVTVTPAHKFFQMVRATQDDFCEKEQEVDPVTATCRSCNCYEIATSHSILQKLSCAALTGWAFTWRCNHGSSGVRRIFSREVIYTLARGGGGGGGGGDIFLLPQKKLGQFPRHGDGVSSYMTDLSDNSARRKKQVFRIQRGVFEHPPPPPPPPP